MAGALLHRLLDLLTPRVEARPPRVGEEWVRRVLTPMISNPGDHPLVRARNRPGSISTTPTPTPPTGNCGGGLTKEEKL